MSYSFLCIKNYYPEYLKFFYQNQDNEVIKSLDYDRLKNKIHKDLFAQANFYEKHLTNLGVNAKSIIANDSILQKKWASENNLKITKYWLKEIIYAQIKLNKPEVLYFQDHIFTADELKNLKRDFPFIKLLFGFCCSPFQHLLEILSTYDFVITCTPCMVKEFSLHKIRAYLMYHAFEPSVLDIVKPSVFEKRETDLIFMGQLNPLKNFHIERIKLLNELANQKRKINVHSNLQKGIKKKLAKLIFPLLNFSIRNQKCKEILLGNKKLNYIYTAHSQRNILISQELKKNIKDPIFGKNMYNELGKAKIGLNVHIDMAGCCAGNIRLFEVTGMGACLLTDAKDNMKDLFNTDEMVMYDNAEDAMEKISWLLNNPKKLSDIAHKGQQRTLKDHNYQNRTIFLNKLILKKLKRSQP